MKAFCAATCEFGSVRLVFWSCVHVASFLRDRKHGEVADGAVAEGRLRDASPSEEHLECATECVLSQ